MKHRSMRKTASAAVAALLCIPMALVVACGGNNEDEKKDDDPPTVSSVAQSTVRDSEPLSFVKLDDVVLTDGYAVNGLEKELEYLLSLNADKLLADFRENAKLDKKGATAYGGGWEGALIGGHTMGHYLSALAQAYTNAGTPEDKKTAIGERIDYLVAELKKCQDNAVTVGAKEGFLWGARVLNASKPEIQFDNVEAGKADINNEAWVPWYTFHKILAGMLDLYTVAGNETALEIAKKLGDWTYERVSKWTSATQTTVLNIEYGGMNDALYTLYGVTGEEKYAVAAHKFDEETLFNKILAGDRSNYLNNLHANTTIPKIIGALQGYIRLTENPVDGIDVSSYLEVAENFWLDVNERHTYATGGNSEWEHFGEEYRLDSERTNANCETCNTYNMLKLTRMLYSQMETKTNRAAQNYLDYYENTYYNAIWSSQNPETGMTTYFQPMASGYFKVYSTAENNFWCCTGSGMESFTKLNDSIYYTAGNAVYVSLYLDSSLKTEQISLTQKASLETSDTVTFTVDEGSAVLRLRRPGWSKSFAVKVNGGDVVLGEKDYFVSVDVKKGDTVTVELKKGITVCDLPDQAGEFPVYAFRYGPFLLSADLGTEGMTTTVTGVNVTVPQSAVRVSTVGVTAENGNVEDFLDHIDEYMTKGENNTFTLQGTNCEYVFSYHFRRYEGRYAIYLPIADAEKVQEEYEAWVWTSQDKVQPGYGQNESDSKHSFSESGQGSVGDSSVATRYAKANGSFSYRFEVTKGTENRLVLTLLGEDAGKTLLVKAGNTTLYSGTLKLGGGSYTLPVSIPSSVVNSLTDTTYSDGGTNVTKTLLTVTFSGVDGAESARLSGEVDCQRLTFDKSVEGKVRDNKVAYFVNCGDCDVYTLNPHEKFGMNNSVTEQVYGADPVTGKKWGIVDVYNWTWSTQATYPGSYDKNAQPNGGVFSKSTWAYEFGISDTMTKEQSNRYTKNHTECGLSPALTYKFDLDDGNYKVKVYFADPWTNVSTEPSVKANGTAKLTNAAMNIEHTFEVTVSDGELTLEFTTSHACINLCYIIIEFA